MMKRIACLAALFVVASTIVSGQLIPNPEISNDLKTKHWNASWINVPDASPTSYGVYFFRNKVNFESVPEELIIHVTADNRYKLFINGEWIGLGPARSDSDNWNYETYDISGYLKKGKNIISAIVWNYGQFKPWAQISVSTGFIVQSNNEAASTFNTPGTWKGKAIDAYKPLDVDREALGTFIVVGPGDDIDGSLIPWEWQNTDFDDSNWSEPVSSLSGAPKGVGTDITHALVPRSIPAMELRKIKSPHIRIVDAKILESSDNNKIEGYVIPKQTKTTILLDQQELVTAYPNISLTGGEGSKVKISYAEALYDENGRKQHRDSVKNMSFKGNSDLFRPDGKANRTYSTLWFRTFRYILLEIETKDDPLTLNTFSSLSTGYPFEEKAYFKSNDTSIQPIWDVAWRTSRLCANELFYDCPYYEQMQYVGDTRVQSLISLYMSGDDRLMRKAINDYYNSINPEGLTQSRYPTQPRQIIPTFSLFWVSMIHDYLWHRNDYMFAAKYLVSIQHVLQWFEVRIDKNTGMIGPLEYWPFVDWTDEWPWDNEKRIGGVPPGGQEGNSSIITLQYAMTLNQASKIFIFYGLDALAAEYSNKAKALIEATRKNCWDENREIFADTPDKESFSQHANTFAVLASAIPKDERALFMEKIIRDEDLVQASIYFRFYLHRAAIESGLGNKYLSMMGPWKKMLAGGLTTFAEIPDLEGTRSDCHAWSSSPLYELLASVTGIRPASIGFESVIIEPHPGKLEWIKAGMPHSNGEISLDLNFDKDGSVKGTVTVPPGLYGIFVWDDQTHELNPGKQKISMKSMDSRFILK